MVTRSAAIASIGASRGAPLAAYRLASVKFLQPVIAPATLSIRHGEGASGIEFSIADGDRVVASGRIDSIDGERSARS